MYGRYVLPLRWQTVGVVSDPSCFPCFCDQLGVILFIYLSTTFWNLCSWSFVYTFWIIILNYFLNQNINEYILTRGILSHSVWITFEIGRYVKVIIYSTYGMYTTHSAASMMTSSNANIFRVTGHLCGEIPGSPWILRTKASDAKLWCFLWFASE